MIRLRNSSKLLFVNWSKIRERLIFSSAISTSKKAKRYAAVFTVTLENLGEPFYSFRVCPSWIYVRSEWGKKRSKKSFFLLVEFSSTHNLMEKKDSEVSSNQVKCQLIWYLRFSLFLMSMTLRPTTHMCAFHTLNTRVRIPICLWIYRDSLVFKIMSFFPLQTAHGK